MSIRPVGSHIVLRRLEPETVTGGGVVIPDTAKETSQRGRVVAVGRGQWNEHGIRVVPELKKGDRVLFRRYAGTEFEYQGHEHVVVTEDDILGVLE